MFRSAVCQYNQIKFHTCIFVPHHKIHESGNTPVPFLKNQVVTYRKKTCSNSIQAYLLHGLFLFAASLNSILGKFWGGSRGRALRTMFFFALSMTEYFTDQNLTKTANDSFKGCVQKSVHLAESQTKPVSTLGTGHYLSPGGGRRILG